MPNFPERLTTGGDRKSMTYVLAEGHYLIHTSDTETLSSSVEHFSSSGLMSKKLPDYIEATRMTLEPAGYSWIEILPTFSTADAEAQFSADDSIDEVKPVYFAQGAGPESAATPIHETINIELEVDADVDDVLNQIEALGLSRNDNASSLLAPIKVFQVKEGTTLEEATVLLDQVLAIPDVISAEFDWLKLETYLAAPNDPNFTQQWGLNAISLAGARDLATGSPNVWIAIIDSGFDLTHPDIPFTPNTAANPTHFNAIQALAGDLPPYDAGSSGVSHGTAVAGIAAARTDNALGVAGVGGGCQVMPVRLGTVPTANRVAAGVNWAANNGARVASMSLGTTATVTANNAMANAWAAGVVICAATGNSGGNTTSPSVNFPAQHANVIAVGASDQNGERKRPASADGEGWGSQFDNNTDVVAPGVRIWTTDEQGGAGYNDNNGGPIRLAGVDYPSSGDAGGDYFSVFNGTSSATPHVAGLAGLLFSANPSLTNSQVRNLIESTCTKINPGLYPYSTVAGRPNGTWHQEVGYGQINMRGALLSLFGEPDLEIAFREGWINFPSTTGRKQRNSSVVGFDRSITTYQVMLKGFNIRYDNGDHHILETEVDLDSSVSGTSVTVNGDFLLRDSSGNIDDPYRGWINYVVIAELG